MLLLPMDMFRVERASHRSLKHVSFGNLWVVFSSFIRRISRAAGELQIATNENGLIYEQQKVDKGYPV